MHHLSWIFRVACDSLWPTNAKNHRSYVQIISSVYKSAKLQELCHIMIALKKISPCQCIRISAVVSALRVDMNSIFSKHMLLHVLSVLSHCGKQPLRKYQHVKTSACGDSIKGPICDDNVESMRRNKMK